MKAVSRITLLVLVQLLFCVSLNAVEVADLKVEYTETPLGVDITNPRFSWSMVSKERGACQKAYRIVVMEESGQEVWDTGKIESGVSLNIKYDGKMIEPASRYNWQVTVWDNKNKVHTAVSWFETGLMDADISAWDGAQWIGGGDEDMVLYSQYLPVFKINYSVRLCEQTKSTKAGFVYGADDIRLLDRNKNLYQLDNELNASYIMTELDVSPLSSGGNARLNIYRAGYAPQDKPDIPLRSFDIPLHIINDDNKYETHRIYIASTLGDSRIYIDSIEKGNMVASVNLNPLGHGGDFIAFPVVADIGFSLSEGQSAYFSDLEIRNFRSPSNALFNEKVGEGKYDGIFSANNSVTVEGAAYFVEGGDSGVFAVADPSRNSMPMLRTTFTTPSAVSKARLYVTSRGIYEFYINGTRIGDDYFNPGLTQYNKTHMYQTYDVTENILQGKNAMGAMLGEGWWSGGATFIGDFWNFFGDRQSLLAKLVITYSDGREEIIVTNPRTWRYFGDGPLAYGSFFQGEVYDASKDESVNGWSTAEYNDSQWEEAAEVDLQANISHDESNRRNNMPEVDDYGDFKLVGQFGETAKKIKELTAVAVEEVRPGVYVYDMGQNMVGVPKISLSGMEPGRRIIMRFAEVKYPDLPEYKDRAGMIMLENIRAAMAQDIYITKGYYESMYGRIESGWAIEEDSFVYTLTVPANTSATLYLKASSKRDVTESDKPLSSIRGVKYIGEQDGKKVFELQSGKYKIKVRR